MDKIRNVRIVDCDDSFYIKPARMVYEQDGKEKIWDLMRVHDSIAVIIYNTSRKVLLFVKQFRPAVYYAVVELDDVEGTIDTEKYPPKLGMSIELCAGIVDKDASLAEIAKDEVLEECGYSVPLPLFEKVTSYRSGVGVAASIQTLFYVEVTDDMKVSEGGGNPGEGEYIEVVEMDLPKAQSLIFDESVARPPSLLLALQWFLQNRAPKTMSHKL